MDQLTRFAISNARFTWLLIATVTLAGVGVFLTQPRQEDPEITIRNAQVVTRLPGLSPERIEQLVTRPIEDQIKTIPEVEEIKSLSTTGLSIVTPEVAAQFDDVKPIWADLRNKMDDLAPRLPEGTVGPQVNDDYGRVSVVTLALTGEEFTLAELHGEARDVRDALGALPLVARVDLFGVQPEKIWIEVDTAFMAQFRLNPEDIVAALVSQNIVLPGGSVEAEGLDIVIQATGDFRSVDDIRRVALEAPGGQLVYLEDLATVRRGYVDPPDAPAYYDGKPALVLGVSMVPGSNVVELGRLVQEELAELRGELPLGMELDVAIFQPDLVEASVRNASENLLQTVVVVLVVVMLALGFRTGLIVGAMVPLTMMATLVGMSLWGIELHRVSIAAIIVALGLLVDNGVVIAEDIKKRLDLGAERLEAALATPRTLAFPLLTSSLTTVAAFMPLVLIEGGSGEFLKSLGQVLSVALLSSWLIAITVIPAFCYWFLPSVQPGTAPEEASYDGRAYRLYRAALTGLLRWRRSFVLLMVGLLFSATIIFGVVRQRSLGPSERNQFTVYLDLPAGASVSQTMEVTERLNAYLLDPQENPEVSGVLSYVGSGGPRFFLALSPNDPQPNKAFLVVNTERADQIEQVMARVEDAILERLPEASGRTDILFLGQAPLGTVELLIRGPEIDTLRRIAAQVTDVFHEVPGIRAVRNDWENAVFKMLVEVDQERARRAGVTSEAISQTLSALFDGADVTTYREGELSIPVALRAQESDRGSLDGLRTVEFLSSNTGDPVPLVQVADLGGEVEPSRIRRLDQERAMTVLGKRPGFTATELFALMEPGIQEIEAALPPGYTLEVEGEIKDAEESGEELFKFAPHALFAIVLLLVLQFNSFRRPAIILFTIPLVLIGANYGLFAFRGYFDFTAMLGLFSLAGIIINNGIVLIDRIDEARGEGMSVGDAVMDAAMARARPIIMTTITTIVGLVPLALFGGEFWYSMAIVIMCGLGVGSVLTLAFVPVLYSLLFDRRGKPAVAAAAATSGDAAPPAADTDGPDSGGTKP